MAEKITIMKGEMIYKILDFLEDISMDTADFCGAFLKAGYGATAGKIDREYRLASEKTYTYQLGRDRKRHLQQYLYKLKRQGLVLENSSKQVILSVKGKRKLRLLKNSKILDKNSYKIKTGKKLIIISYDLPTPFNRERDILRELLKALGFNMIHKSVWVGKVIVPKEFIIAIEKLGILRFMEILEVTKTGSLSNYIE